MLIYIRDNTIATQLMVCFVHQLNVCLLFCRHSFLREFVVFIKKHPQIFHYTHLHFRHFANIINHRCPLAVPTQGVISTIDFLCAGFIGIRNSMFRLSLFMDAAKFNLQKSPYAALRTFPLFLVSTFFV